MSEALLWLILLVTVLTAVLATLLLVRVSSAFQGTGKELRDELRAGREEARAAAKELRGEVGAGLQLTNDTLSKTLEAMGKSQYTQLEGMTKQLKELTNSNQGALDRIRGTFDTRVKELQEGNEKKLDEMRKTVDEKLHDTLDKRLGESFKLVSDRLEVVQKGLGEMQNLARGVGDLKRVLTNVKARDTWAEVQLGAILEQVLTPGQYERNVGSSGFLVGGQRVAGSSILPTRRRPQSHRSPKGGQEIPKYPTRQSGRGQLVKGIRH